MTSAGKMLSFNRAATGDSPRESLARCLRETGMDHLADVKKYVANPDEKAVAGMAKTYALVMSKADTKWVAASDPGEIQTVVDNFCKKKLGRKESNEVLVAACNAIGTKMKDTRNKSRLVFYYLLADHFGQLAMFHPKA
jgi:hypothetical protein